MIFEILIFFLTDFFPLVGEKIFFHRPRGKISKEKNKDFKNHECPQLHMNYATRVFNFFCFVFFLSYLLCLNFPGKPARACGFKTEKSYLKLEKR